MGAGGAIVHPRGRAVTQVESLTEQIVELGRILHGTDPAALHPDDASFIFLDVQFLLSGTTSPFLDNFGTRRRENGKYLGSLTQQIDEFVVVQFQHVNGDVDVELCRIFVGQFENAMERPWSQPGIRISSDDGVRLAAACLAVGADAHVVAVESRLDQCLKVENFIFQLFVP